MTAMVKVCPKCGLGKRVDVSGSVAPATCQCDASAPSVHGKNYHPMFG